MVLCACTGVCAVLKRAVGCYGRAVGYVWGRETDASVKGGARGGETPRRERRGSGREGEGGGGDEGEGEREGGERGGKGGGEREEEREGRAEKHPKPQPLNS
eukprot:3092589-Rhodomonas_salina.3